MNVHRGYLRNKKKDKASGYKRNVRIDQYKQSKMNTQARILVLLTVCIINVINADPCSDISPVRLLT